MMIWTRNHLDYLKTIYSKKNSFMLLQIQKSNCSPTFLNQHIENHHFFYKASLSFISVHSIWTLCEHIDS